MDQENIRLIPSSSAAGNQGEDVQKPLRTPRGGQIALAITCLNQGEAPAIQSCQSVYSGM